MAGLAPADQGRQHALETDQLNGREEPKFYVYAGHKPKMRFQGVGRVGLEPTTGGL